MQPGTLASHAVRRSLTQPRRVIGSAARRVLMVKPHWGRLLLSGEKTLEIRGSDHYKYVGERIGISYSGTSAIQGFVDFVGTVGPLDPPTWRARRADHRVGGEQLPYGAHTWGWAMANPFRLNVPIQFERNAAVIFQRVWL